MSTRESRENNELSFKDLFEQSLAKEHMQPGSVISGKIIRVGDDYVTVNVGLKSEGRIPIDQFYNENRESGGR